MIEAGIRCIDDAQAMCGTWHGLGVAYSAINQHVVTTETHHPVVAHIAYIDELIVIIKSSVLNHQRYFVLALRQIEGILLIIVHDQHSAQTLIDLKGCALVWVRVKPVSAGTVVYGDLVDIAFTWLDGIHRMSIHALLNIQTMPVHDALLGQLILEMDTNSLPAPNTNNRNMPRAV